MVPALRKGLEIPGVHVVISKRPCIFVAKKFKKV